LVGAEGFKLSARDVLYNLVVLLTLEHCLAISFLHRRFQSNQTPPHQFEIDVVASLEASLYISGLKSDITIMDNAIQGHWEIEIFLPWSLNILFMKMLHEYEKTVPRKYGRHLPSGSEYVSRKN